METINSDAIIDVPTEIAVCPYCGGKLSLQCNAWDQEDDGTWSAGEIELDCNTEPVLSTVEGPVNLRSAEYSTWLSVHTYMPYVYWLPVEMTVQEWLSANYRFDLSDPEGDLKRWNEAVKDFASLPAA